MWPLFDLMILTVVLNSVHTQNVQLAVFTAKHQQLERNFTELGVKYSGTTKNITVKHIIVENLNERKLCNELMANRSNSLRTYLFDLSANSFVVGQFGRKFALPSIRVWPSSDNTKSQNNDAWKALNNNEKEFLITMQTIPTMLVNSLTDIARKFSYTKIIVIYDRNFETAILMLKFDGFEAELISWDGTEDKEFVRKFGDIKLRNSDMNNLFVLGSLSCLSHVLSRAYEFFLFGPNYNWIVISHQIGPVACSGCVQAKLFHVQPIESRLFHYAAPIDSNVTQSNSASILDAVSKYFHHDFAQYYARTIDRIVADNFTILRNCNTPRNWPSEQRFASFFSTSKRPFHGKFGNFIVGQNLSYQELTLRIDNVRIMNAKIVHNQSVAEWQFEGNNLPSFYFKSGVEKQQLSNIPHFRVVTMLDPPFVMQVSDNTTIGNERFYGYCIDLLREIANQSNFRFEYTIRLTENNSYGFKYKNGDWGGLIGELTRNRADIIVAPMSVMAEREMVIDYTVPFYDLVGISILMKKPAIQAHLFKFLTVLETSVWFCILGAYLFTSILLYLFDRYSPYSYKNTKNKHEHDEERREFTLKECLWFCMTSLTPQGGGEAPKNLSGRLVAATWWLFGFIIIASYTANLAAFLTVSRLESPIDSLEDLSKQFKIKYASQRGTSASLYFERMAGIEEKFYEIWKAISLNDSLTPEERSKFAVWDYPISDKYTKIWAQMEETGQPRSWLEGLRRVRSDKQQFAFIAKSTRVKYAVLTNCDMQIIGPEFSRKPIAFGVRKNSQLKEHLSRAILRLLNERKLENLKEKWWNQNPEKADCGDTHQSDGISLKNIGGVFVIILMGILIATVTLVVEYIYFKNKLPKQANHTTAMDECPAKAVPTQTFGRVQESGNTNSLSRRTSRQNSDETERSGRAEFETRRNHQHYYSTNLATHLHHRQYPRLSYPT